MFYQIEQVLDGQQFETGKFYKGRGILVCETNQGLFALKEFHGQNEKAERLFALGEFLRARGISCDYMVKNKDGELLTQGVDGTRYSCHHWVKGRECDARNRMDIVMTASFLAKFHAVGAGNDGNLNCVEKTGSGFFASAIGEEDSSRTVGVFRESETCETGDENQSSSGAVLTSGKRLPYRGISLRDECLRHDRELRRIRKYILHRKNKTDFERLYLAACGRYLEQSAKVISFLDGQKELLSQCRPGICHGDFNQHNVIIASDGMTLVHMEHAYIGSQAADLCHFLRKMLEKHEWSDTLGLETVREYSRIRAMDDADWMELYCRLCYPEKFWKIANRYFQSNKVWDSGNHYEKLKKEIRQDRMRQRFLETFKRAKL